MGSNPFRDLPSVHELLQFPAVQALAAQHAHDTIVTAIRQELEGARRRITAGDQSNGELSLDALAVRLSKRLEKETRPNLRPVINATGIVLHTNLGRAPMAEDAARAAYEAARGYSNLELDLETG